MNIKDYQNHFTSELSELFPKTEVDTLDEFIANFNEGVDYCFEIAEGESFGDENLASIKEVGSVQLSRFKDLVSKYESAKANAVVEA